MDAQVVTDLILEALAAGDSMRVAAGIDLLPADGEQVFREAFTQRFEETNLTFEEFVDRLRIHLELPRQEYSYTDCLQLASFYTEGIEDYVRPDLTYAMYYLGLVLCSSHAEEPAYYHGASSQERSDGFFFYARAREYPEAKRDLLQLGSLGYPGAYECLSETCGYLGQQVESKGWKRLHQMVGFTNRRGFASLFAYATLQDSIAMEALYQVYASGRIKPYSPKILKLLRSWVAKIYEYEVSQGSAYAAMKMAGFVTTKAEAETWTKHALSMGYAPLARRLYQASSKAIYEAAIYGQATGNEFSRLEDYARICLKAEFPDMKGAWDDVQYYEELNHQRMQEAEQAEREAERRARALESMEEYRERLNERERMYNSLFNGGGFTAKELYDLNIGRDNDRAARAALEQMLRNMLEKDKMEGLGL